MNKLLLLLLAMTVLPQAHAQGNRTQSTPAAQSSVTLSCKGTLTHRNIAANILVPSGATCLLNDTMITGNVQVQRNATLYVRNTNVQGQLTTTPGYRVLDVQGSIVQGELRAEQGGRFNMNDSQVMGHVRVNRNTGPLRLAHATLNRDLECLHNRLAPTGTWLRVDGRQTGQCSRL